MSLSPAVRVALGHAAEDGYNASYQKSFFLFYFNYSLLLLSTRGEATGISNNVTQCLPAPESKGPCRKWLPQLNRLPPSSLAMKFGNFSVLLEGTVRFGLIKPVCPREVNLYFTSRRKNKSSWHLRPLVRG